MLASDLAALSMPNGSIRPVANRPCGSRVDGSDGARGMLSFGAIGWPLRWLAVVTVVLVRRAVGPSTERFFYPARGDDRIAAVGR